jgi:putative ABC transport system permease protein
MTGKRLKEISIRKVLGASRQTIVALLLRDLLTLMLAAGLISVPLAWYATNSWLYSFAHKMVLTWDIFALPVLVLVLVCLVTVSSHIVRGANSNPAQVLKSE